MNFSYWEYKTWLSSVDFTIVGSGIVGLTTALQLRARFPGAKILVLEKGMLPQGASTKNAGFACFGSISEILSDLKKHSEQEVLDLIRMRWEGIQWLRNRLGDKAMDYQMYGGHEIFLSKDTALYEECLEEIHRVNALVYPIFQTNVFQETTNCFQFQGIHQQYITHLHEGQLDTGKMMLSLLQAAQRAGILILNGLAVTQFVDNDSAVQIQTDQFEFSTNKLLIATNGFAQQFLSEDIQPARAQVIVTNPIPGLAVNGTFHFDEGYYYFRNIDERILFGGGRNLDFAAEATSEFGQTVLIQDTLERLLREVILPETDFEIAHKWSGIMGVGEQKKPIVKQLSNNTYCGVRLGGMGVAIGSLIGKELADML